MKLKSITLFIVAALLICLGNRSLWNRLSEERKANKKLIEDQDIAIGDVVFEVQKMDYDKQAAILKNTHAYAQTIRVENPQNRKKKNKISETDQVQESTSKQVQEVATGNVNTQVESGNVHENASETK
jgi:predicted membrane chloride channel (bestrophin family)